MARTILEAQDIDTKGNDVHSTMAAVVLISAITFNMRSKKDPTPEEAQSILNEAISGALNLLEKNGYSIVKREVVPAAFSF